MIVLSVQTAQPCLRTITFLNIECSWIVIELGYRPHFLMVSYLISSSPPALDVVRAELQDHLCLQGVEAL
jgi:hypothetical protein